MYRPKLGGGDGRLKSIRNAAHAVAARAAMLAGAPEPDSDAEPEELLEAILRSLRAIAESRANERREAERRLEAANFAASAISSSALHQASESSSDPEENPAALLALADLRDRLRAIVLAQNDNTMPWVIERLDDTLMQFGVSEFDDGSGSVDPKRHQVVGLRPVESTTLAGSISHSVRSGLLSSGRVLRPQQVVVYDHQGGSNG